MNGNQKEVLHGISTGSVIKTVLVLVACYFLYYIRDIVLIILMAIVLASAVEPGIKWFQKRRVPRVIGALFIYIATAAVMVSSFYFLLLPLVQESSDLLKTLPEYGITVSQVAEVDTIGSANFFQNFSDGFSLQAVVATVNETLVNLSSGFFGTVDVIFGGILSFFLIIVISFYLGVQEDGVGQFLRIVTPIDKEAYVIDLWNRSKVKIGLWMQGQLLLAIIVAVLVYLGLTLIGVRNALLLAVLAGVFEIIPLFGAFLAAAPAILIGFLDGGVTLAIIVAGLFLIIQQFESQLIYPLVVKKLVGVPPIVSILALIIGAKIAGFLGIVLSVPIAAVLMELLKDVERKKARSMREKGE